MKSIQQCYNTIYSDVWLYAVQDIRTKNTYTLLDAMI